MSSGIAGGAVSGTEEAATRCSHCQRHPPRRLCRHEEEAALHALKAEFWEFIWAFFQGIFWPAWMVYEVFQTLST